ncbi:hydrophobin-2 [Trichoderma compactum]
MKSFAVAALFATSAFAAVCPTGLFSNPLCCSSILLEAVGLDCTTALGPIGGPSAFQQTCASSGKQPACCVAPIAGQGLLCNKPAGTQ